ncbi:hypothetical protein [Nostoc sp.]|uniref:hypothetical protein n=1 Tax=Nostoc sp. TaxID=1180 RepID=UPI002FFBAB51
MAERISEVSSPNRFFSSRLTRFTVASSHHLSQTAIAYIGLSYRILGDRPSINCDRLLLLCLRSDI